MNDNEPSTSKQYIPKNDTFNNSYREPEHYNASFESANESHETNVTTESISGTTNNREGPNGGLLPTNPAGVNTSQQSREIKTTEVVDPIGTQNNEDIQQVINQNNIIQNAPILQKMETITAAMEGLQIGTAINAPQYIPESEQAQKLHVLQLSLIHI